MELRDFIVFGVSHTGMNLVEREEFIREKPQNIIEEMKSLGIINGYVNLSTCLRVEFYLELNREKLETFDEKTFLQKYFFKGKREYSNLFIKSGKEAITYLFQVICGYHSVIKGEDQILGQIKKNYEESLDNKTSSKILNVVFNKGIELGKNFRTLSQISKNGLSLEGISLKFIKESVVDLKDKKVLILGVGDLAQSILALLIKEKVGSITITNRTIHKAIEIQNIYETVKVISFADKNIEIAKADIIISITSAPHLVIKKEEVGDLLLKTKDYMFLDLAVPRDIDEKLGTEENIDLYNLDDVWDVYNKNKENREKIMLDYDYLLREQIENLKKWERYSKNK